MILCMMPYTPRWKVLEHELAVFSGQSGHTVHLVPNDPETPDYFDVVVHENMPRGAVWSASLGHFAPVFEMVHRYAMELQSLGCAIVRNGGAYQVTDECVHISKRELDRLQAAADRAGRLQTLVDRLEGGLP